MQDRLISLSIIFHSGTKLVSWQQQKDKFFLHSSITIVSFPCSMNTQFLSILRYCHPSRNHFNPISLGCKIKTLCCCLRRSQPSTLKHSYWIYRGSSCLTKNFHKSGNSCQLPKVNGRHFSFMQTHWNGSFLLAHTSLWTDSLPQISCQTHFWSLTHWNKTMLISIRNGIGKILTTAGYDRVSSLFISASLPFMVLAQSGESVMNINGGNGILFQRWSSCTQDRIWGLQLE